MDSDHLLPNGSRLILREARLSDAEALLQHVAVVCEETDFLTMGPGDFVMTVEEEEAFVRSCQEADNQLFLVGLVDDVLVCTLNFAGGHRPRIQHAGEFGMSVRKSCWGLGMGSRLVDALIEWASANPLLTKINLRVREDNTRAIRLYERKGFVKEGTLRREIRVKNQYFSLLWMGLEL